MKNKKFFVFGIALILLALVAGAVFAHGLNNGTYGISSSSRGPELLGYRIEWVKINGDRLEFFDGNWKRILAVNGRGSSSAIHFQDTVGHNLYLTITDSENFNFGGVRFFQYSDD
jgi:hypothetical protein